jgi:hypothetical protein
MAWSNPTGPQAKRLEAEAAMHRAEVAQAQERHGAALGQREAELLAELSQQKEAFQQAEQGRVRVELETGREAEAREAAHREEVAALQKVLEEERAAADRDRRNLLDRVEDEARKATVQQGLAQQELRGVKDELEALKRTLEMTSTQIGEA